MRQTPTEDEVLRHEAWLRKESYVTPSKSDLWKNAPQGEPKPLEAETSSWKQQPLPPVEPVSDFPLEPLATFASVAVALPFGVAKQAYDSITKRVPEFMDKMKQGEYDPSKAVEVASWAMGGGPGLASGIRHPAGSAATKMAEKFYSPLERALETGQVGKLTIPENAKASGVLSALKYAIDKNFINKEEPVYTWLDETLVSLGDKRISREALLRMVKERSLKETGAPEVLGPTYVGPNKLPNGWRVEHNSLHNDWQVVDMNGEVMGIGTSESIAKARALREISYSTDTSKYGPERTASINLPGHIPGTYQERLFHFTPEGDLRYIEPHDWPGDTAENAFLFTRGHDRKLPSGETAKHLDEIQSQLHQTAEKEGYIDPSLKHRSIDVMEKERQTILDDYRNKDHTQENYHALRTRIEALEDEIVAAKSGRHTGIPRAPFSDLKWAKLGLKEWVDTAVKEGKDSVTWSTGRIVADRYNHLADGFTWRKNLDGGQYTLKFHTPNGREFEQRFDSIDDIGKRATKNVARIVEEQEKGAAIKPSDLQVRKSPNNMYYVYDKMNRKAYTNAFATEIEAQQLIERLEGNRRKTLSGEGAKGDFLVGGDFYERLYDKYMVREAEKEYGVKPELVRTEGTGKWDDFRIAKADLQKNTYIVTGRVIADNQRARMSGVFYDKAGAEQFIRDYIKENSVEVWRLPLKSIAPKIQSEGQRIAMGSADTAQALRGLAQKDTPSKADDYSTRPARKFDDSIVHDSRAPHESGTASWYGQQFHGKKMSNKQKFDMNKLSAAHRKLPFGTKVRVTDRETGKQIVVPITDRGPYVDGRSIDLSKAAATKLGITKKGLANVKIEVVEAAKQKPPIIKVAQDASNK